MGCAFSHTEQIFIIDHRDNTQRRATNGMGILGHVRQALAHPHQVHVTNGTQWLLASKKSSDYDMVLVGHLKSNGMHGRQRRTSGDCRFIEHRSKMRVPPEQQQQEEGSKEWGSSKMSGSPSMASSGGRPRKVSKSQERHMPPNHHNFGLIDFRKRLERVQRLNQQQQTEGLDGDQMPQLEERKMMANGAVNGNNERKTMEGLLQRHKEPPEALIIKHRTAMEGEEEEEDEEEEGHRREDELFCDWDTLSAECCSIQMPLLHSRTPPAATDECSEASFVVVTKRLKVAWEHHQIVQVRRQSLTRRLTDAAALSMNNNNNAGGGLAMINTNNSPMKNTWMPDIGPEEKINMTD